ncbi:MAG TPA: YraN family protein [Solirubrobacteraceae bacterium]
MPNSVDHRRALGRLGEDFASQHLRARGFEPLARNHRTRFGEIDLIAFDGRTLIFVEVKTLRAAAPRLDAPRPLPRPLDGLRWRQRHRLRQLATAWLSETDSKPSAADIRFDAIGVVVDREDRLLRLDHIEGAW